MTQMNRREFVGSVVAAACVACAGEFCLADPAAAPGASGGKLDVGPVSEYAKDGAFDKFARSDKVIIVREGDKIRALSAQCTHKGSTVTLNGGALECPKHHSKFDAAGNVTKGPATVALFHLGISKNDAGHLVVDKTKRLGAAELNDPSSFVKVG